MVDQNWGALAAAVRARRVALRGPLDLTGFGGPAEMTVRKLESGAEQSIRPKTKTRLELALHWPTGTVDRLLTGTVTEDGPDQVVAVEESPNRMVHHLIEVLATRAPRTGTETEALAALYRLLAEWTERGDRTPVRAP